MTEKTRMNIGKALLFSLAILVVCSGIIVGLGMVGFSQAWITMIFVLYFATIKFFNLNNWPEVVVGGLTGITLGYGVPLLTLALGSFSPSAGTIALVVYLVIIFLAIMFYMRGQLSLFVNPLTGIFCIIFMIKGVSDLRFLLQYYGLFLGMALIVGGILLIIKKITKVNTKA